MFRNLGDTGQYVLQSNMNDTNEGRKSETRAKAWVTDYLSQNISPSQSIFIKSSTKKVLRFHFPKTEHPITVRTTTIGVVWVGVMAVEILHDMETTSIDVEVDIARINSRFYRHNAL